MELFFPTFLRFWYTIGIVVILARFLYYPRGGKKEFLFTYILLSAMIALLCILVSRVEISFGFALGIFAIFSLMRYRTAPISAREMTYIFLSTGIAAKNLLAPLNIEFFKLLITDGALLLLAGLLEYLLFRDPHISKLITYDKPDLVHMDRREELIDDLNQRFGIKEIINIKVGRIDAVKNSVRIQVEFKDTGGHNFLDE
jgi:hypothetical protein